jgi:hypothetical protein
LQKGHGGLTVEVKTYFEVAGGRKIVESGTRGRTIPILPNLRKKIDNLKYYYLILTGHWIDPYNDYFDKEVMRPRVPGAGEEYNGPWATLTELWEKTFITAANVTDDGGFIISGFLEVIPKKPVNITIPKVKVSDDYSMFEDTINVLNEVAVEMINYFTVGTILEDPRNTLKGLRDYSDNDMKGLNDQEVEEQLIEILESRGAIIISPSDSQMLEARKKHTEPGEEMEAEETTEDLEGDVNEEETLDENGLTKQEAAVIDEALKNEALKNEDSEEVPGPAPEMGGMEIPAGDIIPDPEIGEIVSQGTIDNNADIPIDEEGMDRAEQIASQGEMEQKQSDGGDW